LSPVLVFPSRTRRYVRLTAEAAYGSVHFLLQEASGGKVKEAKNKESLSFNAKLNGVVGATVKVKVIPEGDLSILDFRFSYQRFIFSSLIITTGFIAFCIAFQTVILGLGAALILPLAFSANHSVVRFLDSVNESLPFIEREFERNVLMKARERWREQPKDVDELYRKLAEKYVRTWSNTNVLEYKLKEYQKQGLTRNEAVRKAAEEEGID
jgi:hypothetical protein